MGGHFVDTSKPSLTYLLLTTSLIEINHKVGFGRFEIRRRIIECKVSIFPDADKRHIDRLSRDQFAHSSAFFPNIVGFAVDQMKQPWLNSIDNSFLQVMSKTGRMSFRQFDVFIQMKEHNLAPVDVLLYERIKKLKLRCSGCGDHVCRFTVDNSLLNNAGGIISSRLAQFQFVVEDFFFHGVLITV